MSPSTVHLVPGHCSSSFTVLGPSGYYSKYLMGLRGVHFRCGVLAWHRQEPGFKPQHCTREGKTLPWVVNGRFYLKGHVEKCMRGEHSEWVAGRMSEQKWIAEEACRYRCAGYLSLSASHRPGGQLLPLIHTPRTMVLSHKQCG